MYIAPPEWVSHSIFYQIFPERFCNGDPRNDPADAASWGSKPEWYSHFGGDLQGIIERLPYLQELGINALYLTPIFSAPSNHKYDTADYFSIDPAFGSLDLFKKLVDAVHIRGMHIVLDAVFNHSGDQFWAFKDLLQQGARSKYRDWYYLANSPISQNPVNYQTCGGAGFLPKLNVSNPEVRSYLLKVAEYWIKETGIDGWRLDVPWKVPLNFWREFRDVVKNANPQAYIVGEIWREPSLWLAGDTCDGIMNYPLREYILDYCVRDTMDAEDFDYFTARLLDVYGGFATFQLNLLGSHDTPRILTLCRGDVRRLRLVLTALFTFPGAPMVYYGDEVGMLGENDPDCRRCMDWDATNWNQEIYSNYKALLRIRREHPALGDGIVERRLVWNGVYAYRRKQGMDDVLVVLNPRAAQRGLQIDLGPDYEAAMQWRDLLSERSYRSIGRKLDLMMVPEKSALLLVPDSSLELQESE